MSNPFHEFPGASFYKLPYDVPNIDDCSLKENFPNCCPYHTNQFKSITKWFKEFPDCCDSHKRLKKEFWFDKSKLSDLPQKIVRQVTYTITHFGLKMNETDWKEDFTDYLEMNIDSFGIPGIGDDRYLEALKHYFNNHPEAKLFSQEQVDFVLNYIGTFYTPQVKPEGHETTNLTALYEVWQNWLNIFPFQLPIFSQLKEHFSKQLPFIEGVIKVNRYTGVGSANMQTTSSLIKAVVNLTKTLLSKVDSSSLFTAEEISQAALHQLALLNESHKLKQVQLLNEFTSGERIYIGLLDQWLLNEKEYFKEFISIHSGPLQLDKAKTTPYSDVLNRLSKEENKFRKGIPMSFVIDHFSILTKRKSKNGEPFLNENDLAQFLNRAFLKKAGTKKVKLNLSSSEKSLVVKRFYEFFDKSVSEHNDVRKKRDYISLITDNFSNGWTRESINSLFKASKTKENW